MERSIPLRQVLGAATVQATRAAITGLIPLTLLALIGWASAGSSSGNTADALRGAGLLWLAAHHVAMDLTFDTTQADGLFSVLPIGLLVIPVLTLRGAGLRLARAVDGARVDILVFAAGSFAFAYSLVGTAVAFTVDTAAVRPRFLEAFAYALALALLAGGSRLLRISWPPQAQRLLRFFRLAFGSLLIGGAGLVLASLVVNFREALSIVSVLRLGVMSALFVIVIALVYLPNAAIWAVAYATGIGFGFGVGTQLTPWESTLASVPAFPLLAALPAAPPSWAPALPVVTLVVVTVAAGRAFAGTDRLGSDGIRLISVTGALTVAMAWFSGGSLIGGELAAIGPSLWKFPLAMMGLVAIGFLIGAVLPTLVRRRRAVSA